jgi:hypothetical protein
MHQFLVGFKKIPRGGTKILREGCPLLDLTPPIVHRAGLNVACRESGGAFMSNTNYMKKINNDKRRRDMVVGRWWSIYV